MKKLAAIIISTALVLGLAACAPQDDTGTGSGKSSESKTNDSYNSYVTESRISMADSEAKSIFIIVAGTISEMETKNMPLPVSDLEISASKDGWIVKGSPVTAVETIKTRLDLDLPDIKGTGIVFICDDGSYSNGAPLAVAWDSSNTGAEMAVFDKAAMKWEDNPPERTKANIYGVYPELPNVKIRP